MSRGLDAKEIAGTMMLALVVLAILVGLSCAGLIALFFAKVHEELLVDNEGPIAYPFFVALGVTALIYAGSAASGTLASFADMHAGVCYINHLIDDSISCIRTYGRGGPIFDGRHYFQPLFGYYALPFFVDLTIALYSVRFVVLKKKAIAYVSPEEMVKRLKIANAAVLCLWFAAGSFVGGHYRFGPLGCDPIGPICRAAEQSGFSVLGFLAGKVATIFDAWLLFPHTIALSLGNQFKLAELAPLIFAVWWIVRVVQDDQYRANLLARIKSFGGKASAEFPFPRTNTTRAARNIPDTAPHQYGFGLRTFGSAAPAPSGGEAYPAPAQSRMRRTRASAKLTRAGARSAERPDRALLVACFLAMLSSFCIVLWVMG